MISTTASVPDMPETRRDAVLRPICCYRFSAISFLMRVLACLVPPAALVALGHVEIAGRLFWFSFGVNFLLTGLNGRREELICLTISCAPFISLFRSYAFYNVILAILLVTMGFYGFSASNWCTNVLRRFRLWWGILIWSIGYYALSVLNTHDYFVNLRLFELTFTVFAVLLLAQRKTLFAAALLGLVIATCLLGFSMLPHTGIGQGDSERLGMVEADGRVLGNPAQIGLLLSISFLVLAIDHARWLNLSSKPFIRWSLFAAIVCLLALTTSRMSWFICFAGLLTLILCGRGQRRKVIVILVAAGIGLSLIAISPFGGLVKKGWNRTFGADRSLAKRTSGRADQWVVSRYAFTRSLETMAHGYGPGLGPQVYAVYSTEMPGIKYSVGKKVALHSLFMQVAIEAGMIGLVLLLGWLLVLCSRLIANSIRSGLILPLACWAGYIVTVLSVSGNDMNSGILIGLALLGTDRLT